MSHLSEEQKELVRRQSAALNRMLSGSPGASRAKGGTLTPRGRRMLAEIARTRKGAATPEQLIAANPVLYGGDVRSVTASLHLTARKLTELGYLRRRRQMTRSRTSGRVQGGRRMYEITEAGRQALR
jgi:hypothetical protein